MDKNKRKLGIINNFIILLTCLILILFVLVFDTPLGKSTWNGLGKLPIVDGVFLFIIYGLIFIIWFNVVKALFYFIVSFWGLKRYKRTYPIISPKKNLK